MVPAADDDSDDGCVFVAAVAVVAVVLALDLLRSEDEACIGEADRLVAVVVAVLGCIMEPTTAACPATRLFSLLLLTTVILVCVFFVAQCSIADDDELISIQPVRTRNFVYRLFGFMSGDDL